MKSILIAFMLLFSCLLMAQTTTEGTILFKETIKLKIELPEGQEHLKDMIPSSRSQAKALYFTKQKSLYKDIDPTDNEEEINGSAGGGDVQIKIMSAAADNRLLKDFANNQQVDQRDFLGKKFLIKGDISKLDWQISGEQKKILGYTCLKASLKGAKQPTVAWFTAQIPISNGPDRYGQLPGMILEIDINNGERMTTASKITLEPIPADIIQTPKKGKKVSLEQFQKIQAEKMKEMGSENGGAVIKMEVQRG
jgi:GLPGLI family protein